MTTPSSNPAATRRPAATPAARCAAPKPALAVWPCDHNAAEPDATAPLKVLARHVIEHYSDPGDLILDPHCRTGITLEQATKLGRRAIGLEPEPQLAQRARARLADLEGQPAPVVVLEGQLAALARLVATAAKHVIGREPASRVARLPYGIVDLVLTLDPLRKGRQRSFGLEALAAACVPLLKPGGFLVLALPRQPRNTSAEPLPGGVVHLVEEAGLTYWQHVIALTTPIREQTGSPKPEIPLDGEPSDRPFGVAAGHINVVVFRKPRPASSHAADTKGASLFYGARRVA